MKSRPAASAICASLRLSGQLPDQRSGTRVTARPDEQFAPKSPILSRFALCMALRSAWAAVGASTIFPLVGGLVSSYGEPCPKERTSVGATHASPCFHADVCRKRGEACGAPKETLRVFLGTRSRPYEKKVGILLPAEIAAIRIATATPSGH